MKKSIYPMLCLTAILMFNSCSSVKVRDSWKADNVSTLKDKNIIVIARTDNQQARIAFENEIVKQLGEKGMKATASFTKFPKLNPNQEVTEEQKQTIKNILQEEGFNGVVLTVIKDVQDISKTVSDGGYYAGGTYYSYYPRYYGGFRGYYYHPMSYTNLGVYVEPSSTTYTAKNYVLETVIYNLDETEDKQLLAVVTSKLEEPKNAAKTAKQYVKAITQSLDKK